MGNGTVPDHRQPVIVGVGQLRANRSRSVTDAREPLDLIAEATHRALDDSRAADALPGVIDDVDVVRSMTWAYDDLPGLVAEHIGATPVRTEHSDVGGNMPVALIDRAAARVFDGESRAVLVCGGEARASYAALARAGVEPAWSRAPGEPVRWAPDRTASSIARKYGLNVPLRGYPLYENALRARLGQTYSEAQRWSAELLSEFSAVAVTNDAAWDPLERTVDEIETVSATNRMLCSPYTLLMVAQPTTDQAAAVIVTSLGVARALGVPADRLVHVWGGAGCADSKDLLTRADYSHSPAMTAALEHTLALAGVTSDGLDVVDLYSCYPVVPKLALEVLRLRDGVPRTVTGGLNAFGAPANNYSLHSIVSTVASLRTSGRRGLVYGNGETVTKHHAVVLATEAHEHGYVGHREPVSSPAGEAPHVIEAAEGPALVEAYTVEHARDGRPETAYVIGRTADGSRFAALSTQPATLARLTDPTAEPIGTKGTVHTAGDGRNRFELT